MPTARASNAYIARQCIRTSYAPILPPQLPLHRSATTPENCHPLAAARILPFVAHRSRRVSWSHAVSEPGKETKTSMTARKIPASKTSLAGPGGVQAAGFASHRLRRGKRCCTLATRVRRPGQLWRRQIERPRSLWVSPPSFSRSPKSPGDEVSGRQPDASLRSWRMVLTLRLSAPSGVRGQACSSIRSTPTAQLSVRPTIFGRHHYAHTITTTPRGATASPTTTTNVSNAEIRCPPPAPR